MSALDLNHEALLLRVHSGQLTPQDRADLGRLLDHVQSAVTTVETELPDEPHAAGYFQGATEQYRRMVPRQREPGDDR